MCQRQILFDSIFYIMNSCYVFEKCWSWLGSKHRVACFIRLPFPFNGNITTVFGTYIFYIKLSSPYLFTIIFYLIDCSFIGLENSTQEGQIRLVGIMEKTSGMLWKQFTILNLHTISLKNILLVKLLKTQKT